MLSPPTHQPNSPWPGDEPRACLGGPGTSTPTLTRPPLERLARFGVPACGASRAAEGHHGTSLGSLPALTRSGRHGPPFAASPRRRGATQVLRRSPQVARLGSRTVGTCRQRQNQRHFFWLLWFSQFDFRMEKHRSLSSPCPLYTTHVGFDDPPEPPSPGPGCTALGTRRPCSAATTS